MSALTASRLTVTTLLMGGLLAGCQLPRSGGDAPPQPLQAQALKCDGDLGPTDNTRLAAVEQQINDGKFYAALASLDAIGADNNKATWLRAEALRRIDHVREAEALYSRLVGTCMEGRAQHGLGLTWARQNESAKAIEALSRARQLLPTDPRVRNDLGYALLLAHRWDAAQFEFLTVLDLAPKDPLAVRNIVLMSYMQGRPDLAQRLAGQFQLDAAAQTRLAAQADVLMARRGAPAKDEAPASTPAPTAPSAPLLTTPASEAS